MTRTWKIFLVLLATLGFMGFMGTNSVLMASHITHFASLKGPGLEQNESGCTTCHAAGNVQCGEEAPFFASGNDQNGDGKFDLSETDVCDNCHSPGGVFPGGVDPLYDPDIGAKANWDGGVYEADGTTLEAGKEKWCATCHDDQPANSEADGTGISAPNVMGDSDQIYGYYASGHGRLDVPPMSDIDLKCDVCHDLARVHIDGDPKTYAIQESVLPPVVYEGHDYQQGYRLRDGLEVPPYRNDPYGREPFRLCGYCHMAVYGTVTNFRSPYGNLHVQHLNTEYPHMIWDSDNDHRTGSSPTGTGDSSITCPTCHNVHGAPTTFGWEPDPPMYPNPVMIRHGELTGSVPGLHFVWYTAGGDPTTDLYASQYALLTFREPSCAWTHCHGSTPYNRTPIQIESGILVDDFQSYLDDATLRLNWTRGQDAKKPYYEESGGPDGSKCMRVRLLWDRKPQTYGTVSRTYDPYIYLEQMNSLSFQVKVMKTSKIEKIVVRLKRYPEADFCEAVLSTSQLQDGVWKLVSLPRASFDDQTWGKVSKFQLRIYEYSPTSSWAQNVYFDDIRFTP